MLRPARAKRPPRIWGYARVSKGRDGHVARKAEHARSPTGDVSIDRQADGIRTKAAKIAEDTGGELAQIFSDVVSGVDVGFEDRKGYRQLSSLLEAGDHLIVWKLNRIDRNPFRLYRACERLVNGGIHLHTFGDGFGELDLSTAFGRAMLSMMAIMSDMFIENLRASTKEALRWRRENGLAYGRNPPLGKRRVYTKRGKVVIKAPRDDKEIVRMDVWDEHECALIREIKRRHDAGESLYSIGRDFHRRNEPCATPREVWCEFRKRKNGHEHMKVERIRRAYRMYTEMLERGEELGA